ncbi:adaptor protein MecA, partial [uncultured Anaerotruncus sp.]
MEYQQLGPRRLRVALTREELEELGLSYDALDYRDLRTRSLLLTLLETARGAVEFEAGGRILVEVAPAGEGGCEICFSGLGRRRPQRWKVRRHVAAPVVYAFDDVDALIEGSVKLFRRCSHRILRSALYRMGRGWRLVVHPLDEAGGV